ncbi:MAG: LPS export ABC transporter periplasmic protein LptC [Desulfatiglandales bacterium]|jgi:LPS export ABC transporter protein LptC
MRKLLKKTWPLVGIGGLVLLVGIHILLSQKETSLAPVASDNGPAEGMRLEDIHYSHADPENKVMWLLDAAEVTFSKDRRFMSFWDFRLKVHPQGKSRLELIGQRGEYDTETGELVLRGALQGKTENGYTFETEYAVYNQRRGDLETHEPVLITGPFFSIQGRGLSFDVNRETLRIHSEVTTLIKNRTWIL